MGEEKKDRSEFHHVSNFIGWTMQLFPRNQNTVVIRPEVTITIHFKSIDLPEQYGLILYPIRLFFLGVARGLSMTKVTDT